LGILPGPGVDTAVPDALSVTLPLPDAVDDPRLSLDARALDLGLRPYRFTAASRPHTGLILGVANVLERKIEQDCCQLLEMLSRSERLSQGARLAA
jgi:GntR family transcriptional regulator/MocR family aminotransferase